MSLSRAKINNLTGWVRGCPVCGGGKDKRMGSKKRRQTLKRMLKEDR